MRIVTLLILACLAGCFAAVEPMPSPSLEDAGAPDASQAADASPNHAEEDAGDPYPYACCPFADEGLTEFDACCAKWRAQHDGG